MTEVEYRQRMRSALFAGVNNVRRVSPQCNRQCTRWLLCDKAKSISAGAEEAPIDNALANWQIVRSTPAPSPNAESGTRSVFAWRVSTLWVPDRASLTEQRARSYCCCVSVRPTASCQPAYNASRRACPMLGSNRRSARQDSAKASGPSHTPAACPASHAAPMAVVSI